MFAICAFIGRAEVIGAPAPAQTAHLEYSLSYAPVLPLFATATSKQQYNCSEFDFIQTANGGLMFV